MSAGVSVGVSVSVSVGVSVGVSEGVSVKIWGECESRVGHLHKHCTYNLGSPSHRLRTILACPPAACTCPRYIQCTCARCADSERVGSKLNEAVAGEILASQFEVPPPSSTRMPYTVAVQPVPPR